MKKTLLEVAYEIATDLHETGAVKHESLMLPACKLCELSHTPNAETIAAMEASDRGEVTKVTPKQLRKLFGNERKKSNKRKR